jgi:branched-chain amino acid transport system substrate-binding protein
LIELDDASDPSTAARNARKLVDDEKVDVLIGTSGVPGSLAIAAVARESKTPMIGITPLPLTGEEAAWTVTTAQPVPLMISAVVDSMKRSGIKTVGYIGFSDAWGDLVYGGLTKSADAGGYKVVTNERYARADTSVTGQVLRIISANPDAVVVGGSGTGGALPHVALIERGWKKPIYHNHGTVNAEFIKVGGKPVEGAVAVTGPLIVPEELPDSFPTKKSSLEFTKRYESQFGAGTRNAFAGYSYDGYLLLDAAVPEAVKKAKPGTPEFREALRAALENVKNVTATHGVYNMDPKTHNGLDDRARVLVHVQGGTWRLMK